MSLRLFSPLLCLALAACWDGTESPPSEQPSADSTTPAPTPTASATAAPTGANEVKETNDLYSFTYSWPAAAGNIPALAERLESQLEKSKRALIDSANKGKEEAESNGFPYNTYYFSEKWKVVASLPGWLSLSGDKLCTALDAERAKKRKGQPKDKGLAEFDKCPSVAEATVLVGSSNGRTFNRIGVWFGPYVAGPYVEGAYELTFGVDQAMIETVKPAYRTAFSRRY